MKSDFKQDRIKVAGLVRFVLIGQISVREAILMFPRDTGDDTIEASYHALVHYEADEDLRLRDTLYKEEQDDYLELIATTLEKGESLPDNIIANYKKYYKSANIPHTNDNQGLLKSFFRNLNIS